MTAEQFAYWMQGFAELNSEPPTAEQWQSMKEHLATVFVKVTPAVQMPASDRTYVPTPVYHPHPVKMPDLSKFNWPTDQVQITC